MVTGTDFLIGGIILIGIGYLSKELSPKNKRRKLWYSIEKKKEEIKNISTEYERCVKLVAELERIERTYYRPSNYGKMKKCQSKMPKLKKKCIEKKQELRWDQHEYESLSIQVDSHHSITEYLPLITQVIGLIGAIIGLILKFKP